MVQQIAAIAVDPKNPESAAGRSRGASFGPNEERGVYLSTDGGKDFQKRCPKTRTPARPTSRSIVESGDRYAALWEARKVRGKMDRGMEPTAYFQIDRRRQDLEATDEKNGLANDIVQANPGSRRARRKHSWPSRYKKSRPALSLEDGVKLELATEE